MNKMLQLSPALNAINGMNRDVDSLIASFGLTRKSAGRQHGMGDRRQHLRHLASRS